MDEIEECEFFCEFFAEQISLLQAAQRAGAIIYVLRRPDKGAFFASWYESFLIEIRDAINARLENKRW